MNFGLTPNGLVIKRLDDVKRDVEEGLRASFGPGANLDPREPLGLLSGSFSERLSEIWELLPAVRSMADPDHAEEVHLDGVCAITNHRRKPVVYSSATARIGGDLGASVPVGFVASVSVNAAARFATTEPGTVGAGISAVHKITFSAAPSSGTWTLTREEETIEDIPWNVSAPALEALLEAHGSVGSGNVDVTGSVAAGFLLTYAGDLAESPQTLWDASGSGLSPSTTVSVSEEIEGFLPFVDLPVKAEEGGTVAAPARSLTTIETPAAGISYVVNLQDAVLGTFRETDAQLKVRRLDELSRAGTATIDGIRNAVSRVAGVFEVGVVENETDATDVDGRPPHSVEVFATGGVDQDVADAILGSKAAGIRTHGSLILASVDSQGVSHEVKFSRPEDLEVWMIVNVVPNADPNEGDIYPDDGDDLVRQAVLEFSYLRQVLGRDVLPSQYFVPVAGVPGVREIEILVGLSDPPTLPDPIAVGPTQIARLDEDRIEVNS